MTREEAYIGGQKLQTYIYIAAMPLPRKFPRWNYKWKLSIYPASGVKEPSEPDGGHASPPIQQRLPEEDVA